MAYIQYKLLLVALVFITKGSCLVCYYCTDAQIPDCQDPFVSNNIKVQECGYEQVCIKHRTIDLLTSAITNRGCMSKDYCNTVEEISEYCEMCTTDYCNSSSVIVPFSCLLFATLTTAVIRGLFIIM